MSISPPDSAWPPAPPSGSFDDWAREALRRRIELAALAIVVILGVAWVVGRLVLAGTPENRPGAVWIPVQIAIALGAAAAMRYVPASRRHPILVGTGFFVAFSAAIAIHLGALGGFDGPYFYAGYLVAPMTTILPTRLMPRVWLTLVATAAFVGTFALAYPEYLPYRMIHIPALTIGATIFISITLGNAAFQLARERFELALELERRALAEASEQARRSLARTLHDDLAQLTTAAKLELAGLEKIASTRALGQDDLRYLEELLGAVERSSRRVVENLRRPDEAALLHERLRALCEESERGASLPIRCQLACVTATPDVQQVVFRVVQESLTNAIKHARARHIDVQLAEDEGALVVTVRDDGRGFDPASAKQGWGLVGMRERVDAQKGTLTIESGPEGTQVSARLRLGGSVRA